MFKKLIKTLFSPKNPIPFGQGLDLTGLPIVTLRQGEKKLNFVLDTGSNHNIIDNHVLPEIKHTMTNMCSDIYGIDGNKTSNRFCIITVSYKDVNYEYEYQVCDMSNAFDNIKQETGVTVHGIIGSGFFQKFQYVLDFKDLIAYSRK